MNYDVIVCGGGIAGVSAALSASRNNAKVLLIEREYALGGLATLGLIAIYLPLCDGEGEKMSSGISEELLKLSLKYGPGEIPKVWKDRNSNIKDRKEIDIELILIQLLLLLQWKKNYLKMEWKFYMVHIYQV